jgi:hypothetical protein
VSAVKFLAGLLLGALSRSLWERWRRWERQASAPGPELDVDDPFPAEHYEFSFDGARARHPISRAEAALQADYIEGDELFIDRHFWEPPATPDPPDTYPAAFEEWLRQNVKP